MFSLSQNFTDTDPVRNGKIAMTHKERNIKKEAKEWVSRSVCSSLCISVWVCLFAAACGCVQKAFCLIQIDKSPTRVGFPSKLMVITVEEANWPAKTAEVDELRVTFDLGGTNRTN